MQADVVHDKNSLGITSRWMAAERARESERADRLFNDPWAAILAGKEGFEWYDRMTSGIGGGSSSFLTIRTRFFDDFLLRTTTQQGIRQVVVLAAGLDTRGFRLQWPEGTRLFELDQPQVLEYKEQILSSAGAKPSCQRTTIAVDLEKPWTDALRATTFDPTQRSVWLMEGILFYLTDASIASLFSFVAEMTAPESWLGLDLVNRDMLTFPSTGSYMAELAKAGVSWTFGVNEPEALLAAHNWQATVFQLGDEGANYGRWPYSVIPRSRSGFPRNFLVTAQYHGQLSSEKAPEGDLAGNS